MESLIEKSVNTPCGEKTVSVHALDIADLTEPIDIMTVSAFLRSYEPTRGTLIRALSEEGIRVQRLAEDPEIDLRDLCNVWLSREIRDGGLPILRVGCIEMLDFQQRYDVTARTEEQILRSIRAYFSMLYIAALSGIPCGTVGLPILGGGDQDVSMDLVATPMISECARLLKNAEQVRHIRVITRNRRQAEAFAETLDRSYSVFSEHSQPPESGAPRQRCGKVFISYSSKDRSAADRLCALLEEAGVGVWYAPRDVDTNDYASAIFDAISDCSDFVVILSRNSLRSNHVLNEIDLAFRQLDRGLRLLPMKIDDARLGPAFLYYLSRIHWFEAGGRSEEVCLSDFVFRHFAGDDADAARQTAQ